jgi:hypothetical protein
MPDGIPIDKANRRLKKALRPNFDMLEIDMNPVLGNRRISVASSPGVANPAFRFFLFSLPRRAKVSPVERGA